MANNYASLADTIKINDITTERRNRVILHKLKNNDESFTEVYILDEQSNDNDVYSSIDGEDIGWLGYYIGQNTMLRQMNFFYTIDNESSFYKEFSKNTSIRQVAFYNVGMLGGGDLFTMLSPFLKNNHNLFEIKVEDCELGIRSIRQLSLPLGIATSL